VNVYFQPPKVTRKFEIGQKRLGEVREDMEQHMMVRNAHELLRALETHSILDCADMAAHASLYRTESRWGLYHLRTDYPEKNNDEWFCHTLLRKKDGRYDKNGEFTPVSWNEAFDVMAEKFKAALKRQGPSGVGMFGSGQWTIWEGYAANKLFKAGFRSNNIDPNARHCMASAVMGFMRTFGMDEPMGCYDDFEAADAFVLWGSNMAEMHPILWSRVTDRRLSAPHVQVRALNLRASVV